MPKVLLSVIINPQNYGFKKKILLLAKLNLHIFAYWKVIR